LPFLKLPLVQKKNSTTNIQKFIKHLTSTTLALNTGCFGITGATTKKKQRERGIQYQKKGTVNDRITLQ
jgi:hypothetical protein